MKKHSLTIVLSLALLLPVVAQPFAAQPAAAAAHQARPSDFCAALPWFCPWRS